jgi:hypothetical protein
VSGFGALLIVGGSYLVAMAIAACAYLFANDAGNESVAYIGFGLGGIACTFVGVLLRGPTTATTPKGTRSIGWLMLVGGVLGLVPYMATLVSMAFGAILGGLARLAPKGQQKLVGIAIVWSVFLSLIAGALALHLRNTGLELSRPDHRAYIIAFVLRAAVGVGVFVLLCLLPWAAIALVKPDPNTMFVIGWAGIVWMPVVGVIAFYVTAAIFRLWKLTRPAIP